MGKGTSREKSAAQRLDALYLRRKELLDRLRVDQTNLEALLLQRAKHGTDVPLCLIDEIKGLEERIRSIEDEIADIDRSLGGFLGQEGKIATGAGGAVQTTISINGVPYQVEAPYPFLGITSIDLPDGQIQNTVRYAGGFEVRTVIRPETKAMGLEFFRHGRRVSPELDYENKRLILPMGLYCTVPAVAASTRGQEPVENIPANHVAEGRWTLSPPTPPQRVVMYTEYPQGQKDFIMTAQFQYGYNCEVWLVQASGQQEGVRLWFYIGDLNVMPAVDQIHLALSFPEEAIKRFAQFSYPQEPGGDPELLRMQNLRRVLVERFDLEELRTACFDLGVDYDTLPGEGKDAKARELVLWLSRRNRLDQLAEYIRQHRPDIRLM